MTGGRAALMIWIGGIAACLVVIARLHVETDMAAFLPRAASPAQRVLVDQVRDGVVSRMVLMAIEGVPVDQASAISKRFAAGLRGNPAFVAVQNGEAGGFEHDRDFLWSHRYLLSGRTVAGRFTAAALHEVLVQDLEDLGSPAGALVKYTLPADPTGEMLYMLEQEQNEGPGPARHDGVWVSADGKRALLLIRLRAIGSDIDGAQAALTQIREAFRDAAGSSDGGVSSAEPSGAARLVMTGPPVFAVEARARIKSDATRLSIVASLLVASALLAVYRSPRVLALAFVPVVSGALAGVAAVGLVFGTIHGITLGFGATLIGEAVDYAVYLFTQTGPGSPVEVTLARIWPTLRLGVLTSICGFAAMLLSSFQGFAQLGLFTITGLAVAVCVTRWVLPGLIPRHFSGVRQSPMMLRIAAVAARGRRLRPAVLVLAVAALVSLLLGKGAFWSGDLTSLSPVPPAEQRLDQALRRDMQAPDAADLIVIRRPNQEAALQAAEHLAALLEPLLTAGALGGFDSPTRYLPSLQMQRARRAALPETAALQSALDAATIGLSFQPRLFVPFVAAVEQARSSAPIERSDLDGTTLALRLDSLLLHRQDGWVAMLSLQKVAEPETITRVVAAEPDAVLVNLKAESDRLLLTYLREGASLASLGAAAIGVLLALSLRSLRRLASVAAPLAAAVVTTLAVLRLGGHALSIFNLFGMLLVVAIGSNYCLFFDRLRADAGGLPRVMSSLLLANGCTVAGFGVLALSQTPVLHDLGVPVAVGTFLSLVFATVIMSPALPGEAALRR